jgi:hypothetical protein
LFVPENFPVKLASYAQPHLKRLGDWPLVRYHECLTAWDTPIGWADWNQFSGLACLGLVKLLAPVTADLFGFDLGGTSDCTDTIDEGNRSEGRWGWERRTFDLLVERLEAAGIAVNRRTA